MTLRNNELTEGDRIWSSPVGKIAENAVCRSVFLMALYFECRINKNALLKTVFFFGDFVHWEHNRKENRLPRCTADTEIRPIYLRITYHRKRKI